VETWHESVHLCGYLTSGRREWASPKLVGAGHGVALLGLDVVPRV